MYNKEGFNYAAIENNVIVLSCSSQAKGCPVSNILTSDRKSVWLSSTNVPQVIILDLSEIKKRPKTQYKSWGLYCWHAYSTNPKIIELQSSKDNTTYSSLGNFELNLKPGTQIFALNTKVNNNEMNYIKIIVKQTFGGDRTYINQVFLFDDSNNLPKKNADSQNLFTSDNYNDDEEDNTYEPITPMQEVKKYNDNEMTDHSIRSMTEEIKSNNNPSIKNNLFTDNEDEIECKETKIRKIEKILKTKARNFSKPRVNDNEEGEYEEEHKRSKSNPKGFLHKLSNARAINSNANREEDYTANTITYSNINPRKNLTPLKNNQYTLTTNDHNEHNSGYLKLEKQLKDLEDHMKSMNVDTTLCTGKLMTHSKSSGFLYKDSYTISAPKTLTNNPFIQQYNQPIPPTSNHQDISAYLNDDRADINYPLQSDQRAILYNNDILNFNTIPTQTNRLQPLSNNTNIPYDSNNSKINQIESKINNLEQDIHDMKTNFDKLASNIQLLIQDQEKDRKQLSAQLESSNNNQANSNGQMISVILTECAKMINAKFNEMQSHNNSIDDQFISNRTNSNIGSINNHYLAESNFSSFESRLNRKIEDKFDNLANNIQNQIYNDFLKPSIITIENTIRSNLDEIKQKVNLLNDQNDGTSFSESFRGTKSLQSSLLSIGKSTQRRNVNIEKINKLEERLYDKLIEKEKKLNELKNEKTNYLKNKRDDKNY